MVYRGLYLSLGLTVSITKFIGLQSKSCINIQNKSGVNSLIHCHSSGSLKWGMCGEPIPRFPTFQSLYTSAFREISGEWGESDKIDVIAQSLLASIVFRVIPFPLRHCKEQYIFQLLSLLYTMLSIPYSLYEHVQCPHF